MTDFGNDANETTGGLFDSFLVRQRADGANPSCDRPGITDLGLPIESDRAGQVDG